MSELEQQILDLIQDGFPLVERPYKALAEMLNCDGEIDADKKCANSVVSEQEVFDAVEMRRASGVIRRIGGVYDSKKLGFISRLCAGKVPTSSQDFSTESHDETPMEKFATVVMGEPAITHNYIRSHEYNVWFTVIAENEAAIETVVERVCAKTKLHDVHVLSATKKYKINTVMKVEAPVDSDCKKNDGERGESREVCRCEPKVMLPPAGALTDADKSRIRVACGDLPHTLTPFKDWGVSCDELREDLASKRMRRFGAIIRHQNAGFAFNAMVCFRLDENGLMNSSTLRHSDLEVRCTKGEKSSKALVLAKKHYISHCYERPTFEGFPYNLYAMMHANSADQLDQYIADCVESLNALQSTPIDYVVLSSVRELKKTSFEFFA
jgi:DNA-binding Lrp family transcriptional regulator